MYKCGYWLEKQKMGSFTCQRCGKEFAYTNNGSGRKRKYCEECSKIEQGKKGEIIVITCVDCGKEIMKRQKVCRCKECQEKRNAEKRLEYRRKDARTKSK